MGRLILQNLYPDFVLTNNIIIETKGLFTSPDRRKHVWIKKQHPELDIRFVFTNSKAKLYKGAKIPTGSGAYKKVLSTMTASFQKTG